MRSSGGAFVSIVLLASLCIVQAASAQRSSPAAPTEPPALPTSDVIDQLERLERERRGRLTDEVPAVTWGEVLRDPDNLALNVAYARTQLARGDLKGASATLERILLLAPEQPQVRLLHGLVLYRLREYGGAERELAAALAGKLPPEQRRQAEQALEAIAEAQRRTRFTLTLAGGLRYDDNRTQEPLGGTRLFLDFPVQADPERGDSAIVTLARARVAHELGSQAGHVFFAEASYYGADQLHENDLDLEVVGAEAGLSLYFGPFTLTPSVGADLVRLADQNYVSALGAEVRLAWQALPDLEPFVEAALDDENFDDVRAAPSGEDRTGLRKRLSAGLRWQALPRVSFELSGSRTTKEARRDYEGYHAHALRLSPTLVLDHGQFLRGDFVARHRGYFGPDRFVSGETRSEVDYVARVSYGAPLSLFAAPLPDLAEALEGVQVLVSLEQQRSVSNIPNYDFLSRRAQVLFTRSFRF